MAGVGETTTTFDVPKRTLPADLLGALVGATAVTGHVAAAAAILLLGLYSTRGHRPASIFLELWRLLERLALFAILAALVAPPFGRWALGALLAASIATLARHLLDAVARRPNRAWQQGLRTVLVGTEHDVRRAAQLFAAHPTHGVRPVATATPAGVPTVLPNGRVGEILDLVDEHDAAHVLVISPELGEELIDQLGRTRPHGLRVSVAPPMAEVLTTGVEVVDVRGLPFVTLAPRRRPSGPTWVAKRVIDFALSTVGLLLVLPVFAAAAIATLIDTGRPVFYRQQRVGRDGKLFDLWKFRSMIVDAERLLPALQHLNEADGPYFKIENDPRVTRVGRWLRRLSIDELPQIFNVLKGDMSLVGPRPCLPSEMDEHPDTFEWRLSFCPGITGMWQVAGRSWLPVSEGLRMDLAYIEHWSIGLDLRILARTASAALRGDRRPPILGEAPAALARSRYLALVDGDDLRKREATCDVSIVIVTHESAHDIELCLDSLRSAPDTTPREVIVVDNASRDGTADLIATKYPEVRLIRKRRRDGFATNVNIGAVAAAGRHLLLLNPDTSVFRGAIDSLVEHLDRHPEVGAVGPRLVYPNGEHQPSARRFPTPVNTIVRRTPLRKLAGRTAGTTRHLMADTELRDVMEIDWLLGAVVAVRREAFTELGGLDDRFRLYCEDIDLCWRLHEAGWKVEYLTTATVQHALGELTAKRFFTRRTMWHFRSMVRFVRLHGLRPPTSAPGRRAVPSIERSELIDLIDGASASMLSESVA